MFEEYVPPVSEDSDDYKPRDHYGNACIVKVREFKANITTVNGPADAVYADLYDLTLNEVFRNVMLMGGAFVDGLKPYIGKGPLVVSWSRKTSTANRPYAMPQPATQAEIDAAKAVMANGDPFAPAVGTIDAEPPF